MWKIISLILFLLLTLIKLALYKRFIRNITRILSQFFVFKFNSKLMLYKSNLIDIHYSVFGYFIKQEKVLERLTNKNKIISAKIIDRLDNFI